ncbi:hypothetical protein GCM10009801_28380 [Streptomyces albiaxialis]|uniref:Lipoprotein n=1 Tax=Streptomyces albiaxialis TaxID=329523 RepID=A0ABP5HHL3_9ACTN
MTSRIRTIVALAACAAATVPLLAASGTAGAAAHPERKAPAAAGGGMHGPVVTHPEQSEITTKRGEVCPFPTHADFPVADLKLRTWSNDAGDPVFAIESGPLVMRVTNLDTGRTIKRDISGTGTHTYPDKNTSVLSGADWGTLLRKDDKPAHKWLISRGFMSVEYTTAGDKSTKRVIALDGDYEDLCETLG